MPGRNRIPIEHRERIFRAFEDEAEDYLLVADTLGVYRSTATGILARYIREGRVRESRIISTAPLSPFLLVDISTSLCKCVTPA